MFRVAAPLTGNAVLSVTLRDLTWGVSNVGTAPINVAFNAQIIANNQVLQTQTIAASTLGPGATQDFILRRPRSNITVIRFAPPVSSGCFVNPNAPDFFEDPTFTVVVDTGHVLPEAATNQSNNSRNY